MIPSINLLLIIMLLTTTFTFCSPEPSNNAQQHRHRAHRTTTTTVAPTTTTTTTTTTTMMTTTTTISSNSSTTMATQSTTTTAQPQILVDENDKHSYEMLILLNLTAREEFLVNLFESTNSEFNLFRNEPQRVAPLESGNAGGNSLIGFNPISNSSSSSHSSSSSSSQAGHSGGSSSPSGDRPYYGDAFLSFQQVYWPIHCVICLVICTLGIFANVTNIIVLTRPNMITAVNTILSAMAFSDLVVNISYIPYLMHELSDSSNTTTFFSLQWAVYILIHAHTTVTAHTISIWLTCVLATWRYFVVCRSQSSNQRNWSVALARRTITGVFLLVPLFCIPNYLSFAIVTELTEANTTMYKVGFSHLADESQFLKTFNFWVFSCLTKLVPCVLLIFFTTVLIRKLLDAKERRLRLTTYSGGKGANKKQIGNINSNDQLAIGSNGNSNAVGAAAAAQQQRKGSRTHLQTELDRVIVNGKLRTNSISGSSSGGGGVQMCKNNAASNNFRTQLISSSLVNKNKNSIVNSAASVNAQDSNEHYSSDFNALLVTNSTSLTTSCATNTNNNNNNNCNYRKSKVQIASDLFHSNTVGTNDQMGSDALLTTTCDGAGYELSTSGCTGTQPARILSQLIVESSTSGSSNATTVTTTAPTKMLASCDNENPIHQVASDCNGHNNNSNNARCLNAQTIHRDEPPRSASTCGALELYGNENSNDNDEHVMPNTGNCNALATAHTGNHNRHSLTASQDFLDRSSAARFGRASLASGLSEANIISASVAGNSRRQSQEKRSSDVSFANAAHSTARGRSFAAGSSLAQTPQQQQQRVQSSQRQISKNENTTRLLIAVMIVFLICELPAGIMAALCAIYGEKFFENVYQPTGTLTDLLALINSSVNFILYCFMSTQFRITFYRVVLHCPAPNARQQHTQAIPMTNTQHNLRQLNNNNNNNNTKDRSPTRNTSLHNHHHNHPNSNPNSNSSQQQQQQQQHQLLHQDTRELNNY